MDVQNNSSSSESVYQVVNDKIISLLKSSIVPWQLPVGSKGMPMNALSKGPYRNINYWLLSDRRYKYNLFLNFNQLIALGAKLKVGVHGHSIIIEKPGVLGKNIGAKSWELDTVYNIAQCTGIPKLIIHQKSLNSEAVANAESTMERFENIQAGMPDLPRTLIQGKVASYNAIADVITMPVIKDMKLTESYYALYFRKLIESTGATRRLNRSANSDLEALIEEMGAAYLCHYIGISPLISEDIDAYCKAWLVTFKRNQFAVFNCALEAQKAVNYILGTIVS